jgi:hypothetical protein
VGVQAQREALISSTLSTDEKEVLHSLLRRLMAAFPPQYESTKHRRERRDETR